MPNWPLNQGRSMAYDPIWMAWDLPATVSMAPTPWIRKHVQALFPDACQILDYYHCSEYLHKVAKAQNGQTLQALEWVEATLTRLYMGKIGLVLGGLWNRRTNLSATSV